jgi:hypothetical protein
MERNIEAPSKTKNRLLYDPAIPLLGIYLNDIIETLVYPYLLQHCPQQKLSSVYYTPLFPIILSFEEA